MFEPFYDRLKRLCAERKTSVSAVSKAAGCSSGSPTAWKNGATPKFETMQKLADQLGISVRELVGVDEWDAQEQKTVDTLDSKEHLQFAFYGGEEISDELYESVKRFAEVAKLEELLRKKNGGRIN